MKVRNIELLVTESLSPTHTIRDAYEKLNGRYGMIITILDEEKILKGIVTDGDLKHALLRGDSVDNLLLNVMNKNPVTVSVNELEKNDEFSFIHTKLNKRVGPGTLSKIIAIPVLDDEKKLLGLITTEMLDCINEPLRMRDRGNGQQKNIPHVLIVGGAGYIGSVLTNMILDKGWKVKVLDNLTYGQKSINRFLDSNKFSFLNADVCDLHILVDAIKNIDCVVYLAEIVGDPSCAYLPQTALKTNFLAVNSMASLCAHANINRFVYTSSCSVYGASSDSENILDEESELNPVSFYARMKIMSENSLLNQPNPLFAPTILRLATVFGHSYRPRFDLVVNTFAKNAYFDKEINVFGGNQWRPNIHVKDVASGIIDVLDAPLENVKKNIFNLGNNTENFTIEALADLTKNIFPKCRVKIKDDDSDQRNYRVNSSKIQNVLDYKPQYSVLDGLKELHDVFDSNLFDDVDSNKYSNIKALMEKSSNDEYSN